jgi:hypothetical protein
MVVSNLSWLGDIRVLTNRTSSHSQEINVLIDSPTIVGEWQAALAKNQNTHIHGRLGEDGVWRDKDGKELVRPKG